MARRRKQDFSADPCSAYAQAVVAKKIIAGPWVRAACKRHLLDLIEGPKRGLVWKPEVAAEKIRFFCGLRLAEGEHAGQPFFPEPAQCFIIGSVFGWFGRDGYRRFRTVYIEMGKGNGKTPLAAGFATIGLTADGEPGAQVYCAAVSRDQAKLSFRDVKSFVNANPALKRRLITGLHNIAYPENGSFLRPLASEGSTLDGLRVHMAIIDEVHEHKTAVVVDKVSAGTKGRRQPLIIEITNSGTDRNSVCYQHHEYAIKVVTGEIAVDRADSWFCYVCALDEGDDWMHDKKCWIKANPNLGVSIHEKYLQKQVDEARGMPAKQNIVARLNFCVWTDAVSAWIGREKWEAVQVPALTELEERPCYGGLDLSAHKDLTALALFWPDDIGGGDAQVEFWTPADSMAHRELKDIAPYPQWHREGHLNATPGESVDYGYVANRIAEIRSSMNLRVLAFDRWRIDFLIKALGDIGIHCAKLDEGQQPDDRDGVLWIMPFGQGYKDMSPAVERLENGILNRRYRIKKNPVLSWCAAGAVLEEDASGNRKFAKHKATGRIDGIVALTMACGAVGKLEQPDAGPSVYETRGLMSIDL